MKSILDPSSRNTPTFDTTLRKTFARLRRDNRLEAEKAAQATAGMLGNVSSIVRKMVAGR
jgi:hypothetical protein